MNIKIILSFFIIASTFKSHASNIEYNSKELRTICKTWGYLKYYHSELRKGKVDWDEVLVSELDLYLNENISVDTILNHFIQKAGDSKKSKSVFVDKVKVDKIETLKMVDFSWINNELPKNISTKLSSMHDYFNNGKNYYALYNGSEFISLKNENHININDEFSLEKKFLILFRFWNVIEYYWPNKHLLKNDWDDIFEFYVNKIIDSKSQLDFNLVMFGINNALNDAHAMHFNNRLIKDSVIGTKNLCINFEIINGRAFVDSYDSANSFLIEENGFQVGDEVISCSKGTVEDIFEKVKSYAKFSDNRTIERLVANELTHSFTTKIHFQVIRKEKLKTIDIEHWGYSKIDTSDALMQISKNIIYIKANQFTETILNLNFKKHYKGLLKSDTIILDLRDGRVPYTIRSVFSKYLYSKKVISYLVSPGKRSLRPGYFVNDNDYDVYGGRRKNKFKGTLVILVNGKTGSIGECTGYTLQQYEKSIVIGTRTWGTAAYAFPINILENDISSMFTICALMKMDGTYYDNNGLELDYFIDYTKQNDIKWSQDYILESAINYIRSH